MHINDLFAERFDTYFDEAHEGKPLWFFVHVPKTAGSSLNGEMVPILFPNHHIYIDYSKLDPSEVDQSYEALFDKSVDKFIALAQAKSYRYCTGHINATQLERIVDQVPNVRPITLLRDPVSRFISDFRYQRSPMHPGWENFNAAYPRIEDYLRLEGDWNKTATSLLPTELRLDGKVQDCVDWLVATYKFIGIQELYGLSLHAMTWFGGVPKRSKVRKRINDPTPENEVMLNYDLQQEIRDKNSLDIALYEAIAPRFMAISDSLTEYLDRVAPRPPLPEMVK
jgi:hypothetical protein